MASLFIDDILDEAHENSTLEGLGPATYDDDLTWIVETFVQHLAAAGGTLTRHPSDGRTMRMAFVGDAADRARTRLEHNASIVAAANRRRAHDSAPLIVWSGGDLGGDLGGNRAMSLPVRLTASEHVVITAIFDAGAPIPVEAAEDMANRLHPVMNRYFRLWSRHRAERWCAIEHDVAFNLNGIATAILDRDGHISQMNAAMRRLTAAADGLRCHDHDGALAATDLASAVRLQVAVRHALAGINDKKPSSLTLVCRRPHSPHGLIVTVSAIHRPPMDASDRVVVIQAVAPDADLAESVRPICALHGLSPAETSLVLHLVNGHTIDLAAKLMRVKPDTARSYLKQIFSKSATSRQADLIRLMLGSLVRLEPQALAIV